MARNQTGFTVQEVLLMASAAGKIGEEPEQEFREMVYWLMDRFAWAEEWQARGAMEDLMELGVVEFSPALSLRVRR